MMNMRFVGLIALSFAACGSDNFPNTPTTPTVIAAALQVQGSVVTQSCFIGTTAKSCFYAGQVKNTGSGCGEGVRGTATTLIGQSVFSTSSWSYIVKVRPQELISFSGLSLSLPLTGAYTITATVAWDNVQC